jgi:hypothetical protein
MAERVASERGGEVLSRTIASHGTHSSASAGMTDWVAANQTAIEPVAILELLSITVRIIRSFVMLCHDIVEQ